MKKSVAKMHLRQYWHLILGFILLLIGIILIFDYIITFIRILLGIFLILAGIAVFNRRNFMGFRFKRY